MIDTHTHVYPDKIAPKVAEKLRAEAGDKIPLSGDFTLKDLKGYMKRCGIEAVVTFCVAERAKVVAPANDFLIEITDNKRIFGFGTILPDMEDAVAEVKRINQKGIKGIKFHSLFQPLGAGDENLLPIYSEMARAGMVAYFHVGRNPGHPADPARTAPRDVARLKESFPGLKIVAAHLGGYLMLEEAQQWVIGKDVYIDTSWCPYIQALDADQVVKIIREQGVDKVLLGTDFPTTTDPASQISWFKDLPLQEKEKDLIFRDNARRLLGL